MATTIVTKNGTGAPTDSDLVAGELAVDLTNGRLYTTDLDSGGTVIEIGLNPSGNVDVTGTVTADGLTVDGTTSVTQSSNAATALTSFTNSNAGTSSRASISFASDTGSSVVGTVSSGWTVDALNANETFVYGSNGVSLFAPASQNIRFLAGGSEKVLITSAGNVGIGTSSPSNQLHVQAADAVARIQATGNTGGQAHFVNTASPTPFIVGLTGGTTGEALIYHQEAKDIFFGTNNAERMRIDSSGNIGIGTSSPNQKLHISDSAPFARLESTSTSYNGFTTKNDSGNFYFGIDDSGGTFYGSAYARAIYADGAYPVTFYTNATERMRIDSAGNVGIGSGTAYSPLSILNGTDISMGAGAAGQFNITGNAYGFGIALDGTGAHLYTNSASRPLIFGVNETERARIDGSGNLLVGCTSVPSASVAGFAVRDLSNGWIHTSYDSTNTRTHHNFFNPNGSVGTIQTSGSSTLYNTSSDERLKDNIVDAPSASDDIDAIQVRSFDWKVDGSHQKYGMVAQELQTVAPEAVSGDADSEEMMGVDYSKLVPMMLKEIQSLRARVAQLES